MALAGVFCFLIASSTGAAEGRASFSLSQDSYDFGSVPQGTVVVYEVDVKNSGTRDLIVERIAPSCGCTATNLASPVVKPGTSEKIRVSFDTSGFFGRKTKTVQITTNDPQSPERVFTITGTVVTGYAFEPSRLDFGEVSPSSPLASRQREVTFTVVDGSELKITKVASVSQSLVISPVSVQGKRATVKVELLPSAPKGAFRDRVIFEVDGGRQAAINVPVSATVVGDLRLSSTTVSFGVISGQEILEKRVQFENRGVHPLQVQSITSSDPAVSASLLEVQPGRQGVLVIKVDPQKVHTDIKATVALATNHPSEALLSLNVFGIQPPK